MEISNCCRHSIPFDVACANCYLEAYSKHDAKTCESCKKIDEMSKIPECLKGNLTAKHFDDNKTALQWVLSMQGIDDVANVGMYGAKKYGQSNWRLGSEYMRYLGSCIRHLSAVIRGVWLDSESGLPHLAHCAFNCLILLEWHKTGKGTDDRPNI